MLNAINNSNNWQQFEQYLGNLGNNPASKKIKGDSFEWLVKYHLLTKAIYKSNLKHVWHSSEIPYDIIEELGLSSPEVGVDILAQDINNEFWAIQCKFHQDKERNVNYQEVATFFSVTERSKTYEKLSQRLICTSAYEISNQITKQHGKKLGFLTYHEFGNLDQNDFDSFRKLINNEAVVYKPKSPRAHQRNAINSALSYFQSHNRGKIIHPCGSGKSLTAYWIASQLNRKNIIIAVPSIALVKQTLEVWTTESIANKQDMQWIAVCSDQDVSKGDNLISHVYDLGIKTTTNVNEIKDFLSSSYSGIKVLITTYQSSDKVITASKKLDFEYDFGVFDEAHKTVGHQNKAFSKLIHDRNLKVTNKLFMTATERQYNGNSNDISSMDDYSIYGGLIDEFTFKSAIESTPQILTDYKIVTVVIDNSEIIELVNSNQNLLLQFKNFDIEKDSSNIAALIAMNRLIDSGKIKHAISFHKTIRRAKDFMKLTKLFNDENYSLNHVSAFHVSGSDSTRKRSQILNNFLDSNISLITNSRCLTEGVDFPKVDAVIFADPKHSKIDIVQAVGRALRVHEGKQYGYVVLPVVISNLKNPKETDGAFAQIIHVLSALGVSDERIIDEFKDIAMNGNKKTGNTITEWDLPDSLDVDLHKFVQNIETRSWDRLSFAGIAKETSKFRLWLDRNTKLSDSAKGHYTRAMTRISHDFIMRDPEINSLLEVLSSGNPEQIKSDYFAIDENRIENLRGHRTNSSAFKWYLEYHSEMNN